MLSRGVDLDIFVQLYAVWLVLIPGFGPLKYLRRLGGWKRLRLGRLLDSLSGACKYQGSCEAALRLVLCHVYSLLECISHNFLLWCWHLVILVACPQTSHTYFWVEKPTAKPVPERPNKSALYVQHRASSASGSRMNEWQGRDFRDSKRLIKGSWPTWDFIWPLQNNDLPAALQ